MLKVSPAVVGIRSNFANATVPLAAVLLFAIGAFAVAGSRRTHQDRC